MRTLKSKVARAQKLRESCLDSENIATDTSILQIQSPVEPIFKRLRKRVPSTSLPAKTTPKGATSCKNIMKNYSRIFTTFALSPMALPYLKPLLKQHKIELKIFREFIEWRKSKVNCIKNLRDLLLLSSETDPDEIVQMKTVFQGICIVFLKFFSVNWIFNGKVMNKNAHLSYRLKILRRIKNPATFTYLEDLGR